MYIISKFIRKFSTGKTVLILFILTNIVYVTMVAYTIPLVAEFANGMALLDMLPIGYELDYVQELFTALGEDGRNAYRSIQLMVDMLYPVLFAICYCLLFAWLLKKIQKQHTRLFYFTYLPVLAGLADYLENFGILTLLNEYPDITYENVEIVSRFSVVKSSLTAVYFIIVIIVLLYMLWYRVQKRK